MQVRLICLLFFLRKLYFFAPHNHMIRLSVVLGEPEGARAEAMEVNIVKR